MRNKLLIIALLGVAVFYGCDNNGMEIGNNWVDAHTRTVLIDTCTIEVSSVLLDSVPTSGGERLFAGIQRSPVWGETKASSFLTFSNTNGYSHNEDPDYKQTIRFDSLTLYLMPDSMFCGDTLQRATLGLHRLSQPVELDDNGYLYGHSYFTYETEPLVVGTFYPKPWRGREMEIRLPDQLGQEFLDKLVNRDEVMESGDNFKKYFNGLVIAPDRACEALLGFKAADTSCMMKLYYHTIGEERKEHVADFKLETGNLFTRVESDRTGTPLEGISFQNNDIPSLQSDNKVFVQGLTGIYTKLGFPYLNKIRELGSYGTVISASLMIWPLAGSYGKQNYASIPEELLLYISNELNVTTGAITGNNDEIQTGSLVFDEQFPEKTYYMYDVTDFIKDQLGKFGTNKRNLQMIGSDYGYTLNDLVLGDQKGEKKNIELHITYAIYNDK